MNFFRYICSVIKRKQYIETQNKFNSKIERKMARGRKEGSGHVVVNGRVMTTQMYKDAAVSTIKELTKGKKNVWIATSTIIEHASNKLQMDTRNAKRRAASHPLYKIMTMLTDDNKVKRRLGLRGRLEYRLNE